MPPSREREDALQKYAKVKNYHPLKRRAALTRNKLNPKMINLANNQLSSHVLDLILKNKDKLDMLRVINLTHNSIVLDKKGKAKMEEIKKAGIIVNI